MKNVLEKIKGVLKYKWVLVILVVLILIIAIKAAAASKRQASGIIAVPSVAEESLSEAELQQRELIKVYGEPPEGFRWNANGDLIALGDSTKTPEDVGYAYIKALSQLEFATASKYASNAIIPDNYNAMYQNPSTMGISQFTRSLYKEVLLSIEINEIKNVAIFDNGRYILTFSLNILDLTDKEFWMKDMESIYLNLYSYSTGEGDTSKANQYLYNYLLDYYSSDSAKKRTVSVDLVLDKVNRGGWLVSSDLDLDSLCRYQNGAVVSDFIWQCYTKWINQQISGQ